MRELANFRRLDAARIAETAHRLRRRIHERFPNSGLERVAAEVATVADDATGATEWIGHPLVTTRVFAAIGSAALIALFVGGVMIQFRGPAADGTWGDWVQSVEAFVNILGFLGVAIYFLNSLEVRRKRMRALSALRVLRSLAHIVDMHQLTKDPDRTAVARDDTASSPRTGLTAFLLTRYLDYCSELLAILSKIAALYVQEQDDPQTVDAASGVEELCVGLSRAIWQKIMILDRVRAQSGEFGSLPPVATNSQVPLSTPDGTAQSAE